jgi:SAM-dependent methyltransferase
MCSTGRLSMMAVMTTSTESFQIPIEVAEAYEDAFVPAFFAQWAPLLCEAVLLTAGQQVLDVACGTGIVARTAARTVGPQNVVGLDLNEAMLTVASRVDPDISWRQGDVAALPLPDASFDAVLCQMALMFFPDRPAALREMARVTRPGGSVGVLVPSSLDAQPAYQPFVGMAARHAGPEARSLLSTYFACGDALELRALFDQAGLTSTVVTPHAGLSRFPSIDAAVATEVESTPLGERITEDVYERIRVEANVMFARFVTDEGRLELPFESLVVVGRRE